MAADGLTGYVPVHARLVMSEVLRRARLGTLLAPRPAQ